MSAISSSSTKLDRRAQRTRAAVFEAATRLFLRDGYGGTTMDAIAVEAGVARRSVFNNFGDKETLFVAIVADAISYAENFAKALRAELDVSIGSVGVEAALLELGERLALAIVRSEVVALRRLLISETRTFPELARDYFDRAPGRVLATLTDTFAELNRQRVLEITNARRAADQYAYLVAGAALDRAMLTGVVPSAQRVGSAARDGVRFFLKNYLPTEHQ